MIRLLLFVFIICIPSGGIACCYHSSLQKQFNDHDLVFAAKVVKSKQIKKSSGWKQYLLSAEIKDIKSWKGKVTSKRILLMAHPVSQVTSAWLLDGEVYLFFTDSSSPLEINIGCGKPETLTDDVRKKLDQLAVTSLEKVL